MILWIIVKAKKECRWCIEFNFPYLLCVCVSVDIEVERDGDVLLIHGALCWLCLCVFQVPTASATTSRSCLVSTRVGSGGSAGWPSAPAFCWWDLCTSRNKHMKIEQLQLRSSCDIVMSFHDRLSCVPCNIRPLALVPLPTSSSSSSASWPSLQRSRCFTTTTLSGPRSWDTALECPHSSVCLLTWSTTCSMPRAHSNRYHSFLLVSSFAFLSAWFLLIFQHPSLSFSFLL